MFKNFKGFPLHIFRHHETVQKSHFSYDFRFSQYISINIFFNTIQIFQDRRFFGTVSAAKMRVGSNCCSADSMMN